jgi:hypothetical protein
MEELKVAQKEHEIKEQEKKQYQLLVWKPL